MSNEKKYTPAVIQPGNIQAKINSIELRDKPYKTQQGGIITDVILNLETKPITDVAFKGLKRDYKDPNSDTYKGQVARVRLNEWGFKDVDRPDFQITREDDILRHLKILFQEIGQMDWFKGQDDKFNIKEVQRFIDVLNKEKPYKDFYLYFCLGSRQYYNSKNYKTDDLYLPKYDKNLGKPFSVNLADLMKFEIGRHVTPPKSKEVGTFEPAKENTATTTTTTATITTTTPVVESKKEEEDDIDWQKADERNAKIKEDNARAEEHKKLEENFMSQKREHPALENNMAAETEKVENENKVDETLKGIVGDDGEPLPWERPN